jgi:general nucleoside transport system ATP-binding protein
LALERVAKRFGNVDALTDASLTVGVGTVHALLGENGAGKTTLMRIAYGMERPDAGAVRLGGTTLRFGSPADAIAAGIGMVHQHFTLVPAMTVAENVALGRRGRFDPADAADRVRALGASSGLALQASTPVRDLTVSAQQRVELLKALGRDARILILDEPTALLAPPEAEELLRTVRRLADGGRSIVLITHKLREALTVADAITVLRRGRTTLTAAARETNEAQLITAMLGADRPRSVSSRAASAERPVVIRAEDVAIVDTRGATRVHGASFVVRGGEILGVAGIEGSGQRELLRAIAKRLPVARGRLTLPPAVGFVPDDRHREGLILDMSLAENYALRGIGGRGGRIRWSEVAAAATAALARFDVRAAGPAVLAGTLSGGNQQKFILARELAGPPPALVVENPGRGLDVRALADVQQQLLNASSDGVAIVAYSSDVDETLAIADRMLVVFAGSVREVPVDRDAIGRAMLGAA